MTSEQEMALTVAEKMLLTYPQDLGEVDRDRLRTCIEACFVCAQACTACADACLGEDAVSDLAICIRTDLDCADVCETTGRVLSRHTGADAGTTRKLLELCALMCRRCGDSCAEHASVQAHCQVCAQACRACEQACRDLTGVPPD